ncbi:transglutaminase family protein [Roseomonas sp. NAR14]|uniref:Transglutaminase family protein n=1 Tax=Roseomonas acroporae TaxID=2937791 RepID=A0A9X2BTJ0_9PROT|nr:transglutaminase family protein [Roseomonas acroporae]MCK8783266.1 transglutaminase family protein [Roseomonas acroporae]
MRYAVSCVLNYDVQGNAPFVFNIEAQNTEHQKVLDETLTISPQLAIERFDMPESGNRYFRLRAGPGPLKVEYRATVELTPATFDPEAVQEVEPGRLPLEALTHLYPSRYIESDLLQQFAKREFGHLKPGYQRVAAIANWICDNIDYVRGSSDESTSARDTLIQRQGVCRDFAHLGIAFCRGLGIPARFVSAYAWRLQPPDFHAVFEAWLEGPEGGAWFMFDPTRLADSDGLVRMGVGRDAAEVAFCSPYGEADCGSPKVRIEALDRDANTTKPTTRAVTLAAA